MLMALSMLRVGAVIGSAEPGHVSRLTVICRSADDFGSAVEAEAITGAVSGLSIQGTIQK